MLHPAPWRVRFEVHGGYDRMSDSYDVRSADGRLVCAIDTRGRGEDPRYREVAERIAGAINSEIPYWRPLDTAPRDGTRVLGCDGEQMEIIYWANGWFNQSAEMSMWRVFPPAYWMPLPPVPKA